MPRIIVGRNAEFNAQPFGMLVEKFDCVCNASRFAVVAHQGAQGSLIHRIGLTEKAGCVGGSIEIPFLSQQTDQPLQSIFKKLTISASLGKEPLLECRRPDVRALEQFAAIEGNCLRQARRCSAERKSREAGRID